MFGLGVLDPVDVSVALARGALDLDVQLAQPLFDQHEDAGIGRHCDQRIDAIDWNELHIIGFLAQRDGLQDILEFLGDVAGPAVNDIEDLYPLLGQSVAVEHCDQLHQAPHVPPRIHHQQQVGSRIRPHFPICSQELGSELAQFIHTGVFQENQVHHRAFVVGNVLFQGFWTQRHAGDVHHGHDVVQITGLHHGEAIHVQDRIEHFARVYVLVLTVGIQGDATLHAGVQDVVDLGQPRELLDHADQVGVLQRERCERRSDGSGLRRRRLGGLGRTRHRRCACRRAGLLRPRGHRQGLGARGRTGHGHPQNSSKQNRNSPLAGDEVFNVRESHYCTFTQLQLVAMGVLTTTLR